jgi:tRNA modification GTPase
VPVELIDTAGLRDAPEGEAETQGIERTRMAMADADFVVLVVDASDLKTEELHSEDRVTLASLQGRPHQMVLNKCDLVAAREICNYFSSLAIPTSARTGEGLEELKATILASLAGTAPAADSAMITNLRQHEAISEAVTAMDAAHHAAAGSLPHEMVLMDLHAGLDALDRLTGVTTTDDLLGLIFSKFCIGK